MRLIVFAGLILVSASTAKQEIIELPITLVDGYGTLSFGSEKLRRETMVPDDSWYKTEQHNLKGLPSDWTDLVRQTIWFDGQQFSYQNYKQGLISESDFNETKTSWNIDLNKRPYSEKPIKCFVYIVHGKKNDVLTYKIDTDNDYDFSDEKEFSAVKSVFAKKDSIAKHCSQQVTYEAFRNGKVTTLKAPVLIVQFWGSMWANIPQHAEANFQGSKILISSSNFGSSSYDPAAIREAVSKSLDETVKEHEFISIAGRTYQNMGVDINKQVLRLKKIPQDSVIYSSQVGFNALPFSGNDFITNEKVNLENYKGKFLFMDFWGTWCGPCVADLPNIKKAFTTLDKTKIEFLGVANDDTETLKKFLLKEKIDWKQLQCAEETGIIDEYNITGFPTTFLIDPNGKIIDKGLHGEYLTDTLKAHITRWTKK